MSYTVRDVARLSGVSVRTLHFYDEIGLLKPAFVGDNGYRYYEQGELLRLQQILFYRELGMPLNDIQAIITRPDFDQLAALHRHREQLTAQMGRMHALIDTLDRTIDHLQGERDVTADELYQGFAPARQADYEREIVERYGESAQRHIDESKQQMKGWTKADYAAVKQEIDRLHEAFTAAIAAGRPSDSPDVQALVHQHYQWVSRFWTPDRDAYIGLGQMYTDHPDFRKMYDSHHPQLAAYLAEAMRLYAETRLA
jgi:DNA-binding transcriptional MerR regulator